MGRSATSPTTWCLCSRLNRTWQPLIGWSISRCCYNLCESRHGQSEGDIPGGCSKAVALNLHVPTAVQSSTNTRLREVARPVLRDCLRQHATDMAAGVRIAHIGQPMKPGSSMWPDAQAACRRPEHQSRGRIKRPALRATTWVPSKRPGRRQMC